MPRVSSTRQVHNIHEHGRKGKDAEQSLVLQDTHSPRRWLISTTAALTAQTPPEHAF